MVGGNGWVGKVGATRLLHGIRVGDGRWAATREGWEGRGGG